MPDEPVDYLVVGHVAHDLTPNGPRLGGTAAYAALTARALGYRVGIVTSAGPETSLQALDGIPVFSVESPRSTTYENIYTAQGRVQYLRARASHIDLNSVPDVWKQSSIVHIGPIADEVDSTLPADFSPALLGLTPQGWMRQWDPDGRVSPKQWATPEPALKNAGVVVLSREDVGGDDERIEHMASLTRVLVVTEADAGCVLYWHGDRRRFRAPKVEEVDATGAGDVFAASFFTRYFSTRDPWESARFATLIASHSVTRTGLEGIPTPQEIEASLMEVLQ